MKFKAIETEFTDIRLGCQVIKKSVEIYGANKKGIRYGDPIGEDLRHEKIIKSKELPDEINTLLLYTVYNNGYVFRGDDIKLEPFLFNINILPGEKFFELDFTTKVMDFMFTAEKLVDLVPCIRVFELHELRNITYEEKRKQVYTDIRGLEISGCRVVPFNTNMLDLYIEHQKYINKDKNIKTFNIDESIKK